MVDYVLSRFSSYETNIQQLGRSRLFIFYQLSPYGIALSGECMMKAQQWVLAAYQYHLPTKQGVRAGRCITLHSECKQYQRESID